MSNKIKSRLVVKLSQVRWMQVKLNQAVQSSQIFKQNWVMSNEVKQSQVILTQIKLG